MISLLTLSESWKKDHVPSIEQNSDVATISRASDSDAIDIFSGQPKQYLFLNIQNEKIAVYVQKTKQV